MKKLIEAVLNVMDDCKGIEKAMTVGSGSFAYKGVSDKDVKLMVGESMRKHKLIILPTKITPVTQLSEWEDEKKKRKQSIFTEVITEYLLAHDSGETATLAGYGHGVDSQDKSAGKATTYALKYTLLYSFLVATGHIDDADNTHSNDIPQPQASKKTQPLKPITDDLIKTIKQSIKDGKMDGDLESVNKVLRKKKYKEFTEDEFQKINGK